MTYKEKLYETDIQNKSGIYKLIIKSKFYVGSAVNLPKRLREHLNDLKATRHCNNHLQSSYNKHTEIDFEIIEFVDNPSDLIIREQYYIDELKPGFNISKKAGSQLGFKHSEETKRRISELQIGRIFSEEARKNYSAAKKGKKLSQSHKDKLSISKMGDKNPFYKCGEKHPQYGTRRRPETIAKLSKDNNKLSRTGVLYDVETGANYVFRSLKSMCNSLDLTYRSVLSALRNKSFYKGRFYASFIEVPIGCETIITEADKEDIKSIKNGKI